jgi:hypothetical protein
MRRLIFGAVALVTGLLAAGGLALRRRRGRHDDVLPLDPVPPLASAEAALAAFANEQPSVDADSGAVTASVGISPKKPRRRRPRKKPAAAAAEPEADSPAGSSDAPAAPKPRTSSRPKPAPTSTEEAGPPEAS